MYVYVHVMCDLKEIKQMKNNSYDLTNMYYELNKENCYYICLNLHNIEL